jgi:subtilisin family serine protease
MAARSRAARPLRRAHAEMLISARASGRSLRGSPLEVTRLTSLMERTSGREEVVVALIDGPVAISHPDLATERIREIPGSLRGTCARADSFACTHGTFVAGILSAKRGSPAPAICPGCTLLVRPIFDDSGGTQGTMPNASPHDLASGIGEAIQEGARIINISGAVGHCSADGARALTDALDYAMRRGVITVAAVGNGGMVGGTAITMHPAVIPVAACDRRSRTMSQSNLGRSIARQGLRAPGEAITSLSSSGGSLTLHGTSAAAPFVAGVTALLWSEFPAARASQVMLAVTQRQVNRTTVVPPLLDAMRAERAMTATRARG